MEKEARERQEAARMMLVTAAARAVAVGDGGDVIVFPRHVDVAEAMVKAKCAFEAHGIVCAAAVDVMKWFIKEYEEQK